MERLPPVEYHDFSIKVLTLPQLAEPAFSQALAGSLLDAGDNVFDPTPKLNSVTHKSFRILIPGDLRDRSEVLRPKSEGSRADVEAVV
jgi:hypothetical protein